MCWEGSILTMGDVWERNMWFKDVFLWIVYLSAEPHNCFTFVDRMFETIRSWQSNADMLHNLYKWNTKARAGSNFRTGYVCSCNMPFWGGNSSQDVPLWIEEGFFIHKWMFDMFRIHDWDNQKVENCSRYAIWFTAMQYICVGEGAFSEGGMLGNAEHRFEDAPVLTMYLYELFSYWLPNLCLVCLECMHVWDKPEL